MRRRAFQIRRLHRFTLYSVSLVIFLSGTTWAWINHQDQSGQAGESLRSAKTWLIAVHGFAAMVFVLVFGTLLPSHVRRAWHARKNRWNGGFFIAAVSLLVLSGYVLYYLSDERMRTFFSQLHLWLGVAGPVLLLWHILSGKKSVQRD